MRGYLVICKVWKLTKGVFMIREKHLRIFIVGHMEYTAMDNKKPQPIK